MRVELSEDASLDLARGCEFYRARGGALSAYFLRSIREDLRELRTIGGVHEIHHGFHRMVARRFPFAIYYECLEGRVLVRWDERTRR